MTSRLIESGVVDTRGIAQGDSATELRLTENAVKVLEARYLKKNEAGECIEKPADLFRRVARTIADVETQYGAPETERRRWEDRFYNLMTSGDFMPNSPTLMNAGREMGMLSACFVLPVRDSIHQIFDAIKHTALIQKAGGGTGFAFDELRPTGDYIASSGGTTSGPISFWKAFSEATNAIQQGAFRRGANMGMMYVHHPDVLKFLHAKQDLNQFTNYNISVKMTDEWMEQFKVEPDSPHLVRNPRTGQCYVIPRDVDIWKYDIRSLIEVDAVEPLPRNERQAAYYTTPRLVGDFCPSLRGKVYTKRDIWNIIIRNAWQTGEPGVVFIDRINEANPTPHVGRMEATNPCGEQPLLPYEACNLGSINLGNFVRDECTPAAHVDWDALRECVHLSTRYLDNVIDANNYPLPEIDAVCKANRKIGLGIMGFADALYKLNVAYNSDEGVAWGERFMKFVNDEAHNYSEHLAQVRGPFPNWKGSHWDTKYHRLQRNSCSTTVAPTGTISIIANCSGGIEPMFSLAFIRNVLRGQKQGEKPLFEVNDTFKAVAAKRGFLCDELLEQIASEGTLAHIDSVTVRDAQGVERTVTIPEDVRRIFVCAHDIAPDWHMKMQAAFQRHNDSSISKTINFPNAATVEDVQRIYELAYDLRCKGVTVYRDGCRNFQPMALKDSAKKQEQAANEAMEARGHAGTTDREQRSAIPEQETAQREVAANSDATPTAPRGHVPGAVANPAVAPGSANGNGATGNGNGGTHTAPPIPVVDDLLATDVRSLEQSKIQNPTSRFDGAAPAATPAPQRSALGVQPSAPRLDPADLPEIVSGLRIRQMTPFGNMHVKITVDPRTDRELEVFAQLGKGGDVATSDLEAICRMISLWLRSGGSLKHVVKQLEGIGSSLQIPTKFGRIMSLGDGLACALKKYQRAKDRFGLRALLLGDVDLAQLDSPAPPHAAPVGDAPVERLTLGRAAERSASVAAIDAGPNGGNGQGPASVPIRPPFAKDGARPAKPVTSAHTTATFETRVADSSIVVTRTEATSSGVRSTEAGINADPHDALAETTVALLDALDETNACMIDQFEALEAVERVAAVEEAVHTASVAGLKLETRSSVLARHFHDSAEHFAIKCPECSGTLALQEGCRKCHSCGWSAC